MAYSLNMVLVIKEKSNPKKHFSIRISNKPIEIALSIKELQHRQTTDCIDSPVIIPSFIQRIALKSWASVDI